MAVKTHTEALHEITVIKRVAPPFQHLRRNFILVFLDLVLFGTAFTLISGTTVIPDFVRHLTNSDLVLGFVGSIYNVAWLLPQLVLAQLINRGTRRKPFITWTAIPFRLVMVAMAIGIAIIGPNNVTAILLIFLVGYTLFAAADGIVDIAWADLVGTAIPDRWRGALLSAGEFLLVFTALGTRALVQQVLGPNGPPFPQNYAQVFGIAGVIFVIAGICLTFLVEEKKDKPVEPGPRLREYLPYLGQLLRGDKVFRQFTIVRSLLDLTLLTAPFYIVFGITRLNIPSATLVGDSILLAMVGSAVAALVMSWLSHRLGSRSVIILLAFASISHAFLALLSFVVGQPALYGAFFMLGVISAGGNPGYYDWIITHAPTDRRPIYVGLTNTISAVSHLAPILGGFILASTSYPVLFAVGLILAIVGLVSSFFLIEPRKQTQV